jgi:hypothetical protein
MVYGNIGGSGLRKNKPNSKPILLVFSAFRKSTGRLTAEFQVLRSPMESLRTADSVKIRKRDLKKQSQFAVGQNWHKALYER